MGTRGDSEFGEGIRVFGVTESQGFTLIRTVLLALRGVVKFDYTSGVIIADIVIERHVEHMAALTVSIVVIKMLLELSAPLGGERAPVPGPIQFLTHVSELQKSIFFTSDRIKYFHGIEDSKKDSTV